MATQPAFPARDPVIDAYAAALLHGAAPGEVDDLTPDHIEALATLAAAAAATRAPGQPTIHLDRHAEGGTASRRMTLVVVGDDMPFLVDSVGLAVAHAGLEGRRLLHPVVDVVRNAQGCLTAPPAPAAGPMPPPGHIRESVLVVEMERAPGGVRQRLAEEIAGVLADVRSAVRDWQAMVTALRTAARRLRELPPPAAPHVLAEDLAFLDWLASDHFTLLGHRGYTLHGNALTPDYPGCGLLADPNRRLWNGDGADDPRPVADFIARADALLIAKSDLVSTVHRRVNCDYISVKRYDAAGRTVGEDRFIGLFTSAAFHTSPRDIPLLRRRVGQVIHDLGFDPKGHNGKALVHVLESFPRDELFQVSAGRLREMALGLLSLLDRPRPKLFIRADPFGRQVSALVYVPRDAYTAEIRLHIGQMLEREVGAGLDHFDVELRSEGLARIQYVFGLDGARVPQFDEPALNRRVVELVRGWDEALEVELAARVGHTRAARIALTQTRIFSTSYRAQFGAREAADDILRLSGLTGPGDHDVHLYRRTEDAPGQLRLKIYHLESIITLSDAVPVLEHFGFRVIEEYPFDVDSGRKGWVHDFLIELPRGLLLDARDLDGRIAPALKAVLNGAQENDPFNALVVTAGLDAGAVAGLRAYFRYMRQTGVSSGEATVVGALRRNADLTRDLVALFRARFDPALAAPERETQATQARTRIATALAAVESIEEDRILRFYLAGIEATLRTNAYAPGGREALALKLDSKAIPGLPAPVPYREIWVYSPRIEGIHLRAGPVARGGLRWSDRRDDFRTEILGLLKAQIVKNAVIVPTGSKGGFYPKALPPVSDRAGWLAEGTECYRVYIRALLSVTDNIVDGHVVPPEAVVRYDADDIYLVVAADKGTATFSDIANGIAIERGFWLGDAFASGGSVGYDHKAMGITARGAWVSVTRHFAELGVDIATQPITVVGVGDMSGDVFGNGMLLSKALKLVAAFDHRHIFLDPDPDPAVGYAERARMFALPRSSWADYDPAALSPGGGVFPRTQKSITLTPEAAARLGVAPGEIAPSDLIQAILCAPADLLWFGGIGTYVKAEDEANAEVGDRANDANRVNAEALRVKAIGEGANLAITQAARIAFARNGGRVNTDFIDNSAGVDTSDHEVNIKIALQPSVASGALSEADRVALLASMTGDVAAHVLEDNIRQTLALSVAERGGAGAVPGYARVIQTLEVVGRLDRRVEGLPTDDVLAQRAQGGHGLARPELAVLLAHAKMALYEALVASPVVDDPLLDADLLAAFPRALAERFPDALRTHRLRREIVGTVLANEVVNRGGIVLAFQLAEEDGATLAEVAAAFLAARHIFDLDALWAGLDALPASDLQVRLNAHAADGLRLQISDILRLFAGAVDASAIVVAARPGVLRIEADLDRILRAEPRAALMRLKEQLESLGTPPATVQMIGRLHALDGAIATAHLAARLKAPEVRVALAYTELGQTLGLDWAKTRAAALAPADPWERLLIASAERDMEDVRLDLIRRVTAPGTDPVAATQAWLAAHPACVARVTSTIARARHGAATTSAMLAHIAAQARAALAG